MKKMILIIVSIIFILMMTISMSNFYRNQRSMVRQRENLAKELGLDPKLYSHDPYFPENYFIDILVPGIPIAQVHQIIKGYKTVYACEGSFEIYYFYSTSEEEAIRIAVFYDYTNDIKEKPLINIMTEDENSSSLPGGNCTPGLLKSTEQQNPAISVSNEFFAFWPLTEPK